MREFRSMLAFHIHVPKAGGISVAKLFGDNGYRCLRHDMVRRDFFDRDTRERWAYDDPLPSPCFMTGHYRLDLPLLRRQTRPIIVTTLRDPIQRMLSHWNFTLRMPGNPHRAEVLAGQLSFVDYVKAMMVPNAVGPQFAFFDDTGSGSFARSGYSPVQYCFERLVSKVTIVGFVDDFDDFTKQVANLLGWQNVVRDKPQNVTASHDFDNQCPLKTSLTAQEMDAITDLLTDDIWFYEQAKRQFAGMPIVSALAEPRG